MLCAPLAWGQKSAPKSRQDARPTSYTETYAGLNLEMIWIPGGTFQMGSRLSAEAVAKDCGGEAKDFADEHPWHAVELDGFWLGKFEVTNAQFRRFAPNHSSGEYWGHRMDGDKQPVVKVTWDDARAFCAWLSLGTGRSYRLPTEAQWEYACRAGSETERHWGDDEAAMGSYANAADRTMRQTFKDQDAIGPIPKIMDGHAVTAPVGSFKPNAFGLHDMLGNVWEWCQDWYAKDYYQTSLRRNPTGPTSGEWRVVRGGSWVNDPKGLRSADRYAVPPAHRDSGLGLRVRRLATRP
jgi:formylglycine-generating enzyme required for sulfatase activity